MMLEPDHRFDVSPGVGNHFAWLRTQMALQRTLLAGVRTSVSLIGFGFTVAQFFQRLQGNVPEGLRVMGPHVPRNVGLTLIAAGVISLAVFTWQYRRSTDYLKSGDFAVIAGMAERPLHTSSYIVSFSVMLIGVAAFGSVFVRF